jgi:hypothetical protein
MTAEQPAQETAEEQPPERPTAAVISATGALRLLLLLLAIWTAFSGLSMAVFQGINAATLAGGLEDEAAQRLLGVHLLALTPVYLILAWRPQQYRLLLWLPYAVQAGVIIVTAYDVIAGNRDVEDGVLPLVVAGIFLALLMYVWVMGRRPAIAPEAAELAAGPEPAAEPAPEKET